MVVHLSSKLSHLAQSFRPQHHFNTLRNAFPSSASAHGGSTTGFFDPANVFQQAANNTLGAATGQAAGAGAGSSAGGAGGAKWHAGRNAYNWGSSNSGRMMSQATSQDSSTRLDEEVEEPSLNRGRRNVLLAPHRKGRATPTSAPFKSATRERSSSIPCSTERPAPPTELLKVSEMGLQAPRLSSSEMQSRYRLAFAQGTKTVEMVAMEREADEMDLGPQASSVRVSGRRASISSLASPSLTRISRPLLLVGSSSGAAAPLLSARAVHTSSKSSPSTRRTPFPSTSPPLATVSRVRRNSTSAIESSSPSLLDSADAALKVTPPPRQSTGRPPASSPNDPASMKLHKPSQGFTQDKSSPSLDTVRAAAYRTPHGAIEAVRRYIAVESAYSVDAHNAAMETLLTTRLPNSPITTIVHLYNQLFEHEALRPTRRSYELVLKAFCTRDQEVLNNISFLTKRIERRKGTTSARGPYHRASSSTEATLNPAEQKTLEMLQKEDYLSPALEIYKTLGPLGDKLEDGVMSELIAGAARRGRIDLALTLFGRVEKSPYQRALSGSYIALIQMFGREKDKDSLMDVFEGYLQARANGLRAMEGGINRTYHQRVPVKHAYSTTPEFTVQANSGFFNGGDDAVWRNTIAALFEAGDSAEAIALLERMLLAQSSSDALPVGYPTTFAPAMLATIVAGFASLGDESSARKWFDQAGTVSSSGVPVELHGIAFHAALRAALPALLRHIYAATLDRAGPDFPLSISDFVTFVDTQIASLYASSTSAEDARAAIDAIVSARPKFERAAKKGWTLGNPQGEVDLSSGLLSRIVSAFAHSGEWTAAANTFAELGQTILRAQASKHSVRSPGKWIIVGRDSALTALGFVPQGAADWTRKADAPRLPIADVTKVVALLNRFSLQAGTNETTPTAVQVLVVESFLSAKGENKGDVEALGLSGDQWYTIIYAFASVQSQIRRGLEPAFEFPGFEPIIDDFAASQVKIPSDFANNFPALVESLLAGGMSSDRARAVLAVLDLNLAKSLQPTEDPAPVEAPAGAAQVEVPSPSVAQSYAPEPAPLVIPTPPSTPPPHVLKHSSAPLPTVEAIDINLSNQLDTLVYNHKFDDAFKTALQAADQGRYAHPDVLGRLLEALGRAGKTEAARQTYTLAYATLPALAAHPTEQSIAWSALEDHMIVVLAVAGELEEVGQHRDRLIQAGSAPSADGYAAMILHMQETTNDAAVALTLFEESQRLGVKPNVYLFNTLISKLSRARRAKDALEYFELMKTHGLRPTAITYGAIINACCKTGDDASADYLFQEMVAAPNFRARVPPYNTMIQFYTSTKPDRARALHYYRQLLNARVQPTGHTYKLLLDCYGSIAEPDLASMEDVFATLLRDQAVDVTGAHWASLIHAYGSVGKDLDKAVQIFDSIQGHASTLQSRSDLPDAVVYEALLNAFIANGRADLCENYLVEMKERGVRMTAYVANTLITGHAAQKNMTSARAVFDAMQDPPAGFAASGNHAVNRHPKQQQQQQQQQSGDSATTASGPVYREPSTWEMMIKVELEAGEAQRALGLMKRVEERAFPEAVVARIRKHLDDAGIVSLA